MRHALGIGASSDPSGVLRYDPRLILVTPLAAAVLNFIAGDTEKGEGQIERLAAKVRSGGLTKEEGREIAPPRA